MLPKLVFSKILQSLKKIENSVREDRKENPNATPLEIDSCLRMAIETEIRIGGVGRDRKTNEKMINETIEYLVSKKLIIKTGYGGHTIPLIEGEKPLPSKEEVIKQIEAQIDLLRSTN